MCIPKGGPFYGHLRPLFQYNKLQVLVTEVGNVARTCRLVLFYFKVKIIYVYFINYGVKAIKSKGNVFYSVNKRRPPREWIGNHLYMLK